MKTIARFSHFSILFFYMFALSFLTFSTSAQDRYIDSLITFLITAKADTNKVKALYNISTEFYQKDPIKSMEYAKESLLLSKKIGYRKGQKNCYNAIGMAYSQIGKLDSALYYYSKYFDVSKAMADSISLAQACVNISSIIINFGNHDKALELLKRATHIFEINRNKIDLAKGYTWMGNIYKELGDFSNALEFYLKSLRIYGEIKDDKSKGYPLLNISSIYRYQKQYEKAKMYAEEARQIFEHEDNPYGIGMCLYRLGLIYEEVGDNENRFLYYKKARTYFEISNNTSGLILVSLALGNANYSINELDSALIYYNYVLPLVIKMGDKTNLPVLYQHLGAIFMDKDDFLKASEYHYLALQTQKDLDNKQGIMEMYGSFIDLYSHFNQPDSVSWYFYQYKVLSDSLYSEQNSRSIAEMGTRYETEKKENEIVKLNLENEKKKNDLLALNSQNEIANLRLKESAVENERNVQSLKLADAEHEKQKAEIEIHKLKENEQAITIQTEKAKKKRLVWYFLTGLAFMGLLTLAGFSVFRNRKKKEQAVLHQKAAELSRKLSESDMNALRSQMNPHFIFNCVHTIEKLLNEAKVRESKTTLTQFSNLTRMVLENSKKREIPLEDEITILRMYMELENARFEKPFTCTIRIDPAVDPAVTMIPPLILQPFVENSIKHGFLNMEGPGNLQINIKEENGMLVCIVEDNGKGRNESMKIRPLSGFKKESLGMKLVEERLQLINQAKGTDCAFYLEDLEVNGKPAGTKVKMALPYILSV